MSEEKQELIHSSLDGLFQDIADKLRQKKGIQGDYPPIQADKFPEEIDNLATIESFKIVDGREKVNQTEAIQINNFQSSQVINYGWLGGNETDIYTAYWSISKVDDVNFVLIATEEKISGGGIRSFNLETNLLEETFGELSSGTHNFILQLELQNTQTLMSKYFIWKLEYTKTQPYTAFTMPSNYTSIGALLPNADSLKKKGAFFKIKFSTANVQRTTAIIGEHQKKNYGKLNKLGFRLEARGLTVFTPTTTKYAPWCENKTIHLMVNIGPYKSDLYDKAILKNLTLEDLLNGYSNFPNLLTVWVNGIPSLVLELQEADYDPNTSDFYIGSEEATVEIIQKSSQINSAKSSQEILQEYEYDNTDWLKREDTNIPQGMLNAEFDYDALAQQKKGLHIIHIYADRMTVNKKDKVPCEVRHYCYRDNNKNENFIVTNVTMKAQGTSSLDYKDGALNLDLNMKKATYLSSFLYNYDIQTTLNSLNNLYTEEIEINNDTKIRVDEQNNEIKIIDLPSKVFKIKIKNNKIKSYDCNFKNGGYSHIQNGIPITYFNIKLNVASSDNVNNTLFSDEYNQFSGAQEHSLTRGLNSHIRDTVAGEPCLIFFTNTSGEDINVSSHLLVKPNQTIFYGVGDINNSKKNTEVLGQTYKDILDSSIEIPHFDENISYTAGTYCYYDPSPNGNSYGCKWNNNVYYCIENYEEGQTGWDCTKWVSVYNNNCNPWDEDEETLYKKDDFVTYTNPKTHVANYYKCIKDTEYTTTKPTDTQYYTLVKGGEYPEITSWSLNQEIRKDKIYSFFGYLWRGLEDVPAESATPTLTINTQKDFSTYIAGGGEEEKISLRYYEGIIKRIPIFILKIEITEGQGSEYNGLYLTDTEQTGLNQFPLRSYTPSFYDAFPGRLPIEDNQTRELPNGNKGYFEQIHYYYPEYSNDISYELHDLVVYNSRPYRCIKEFNQTDNFPVDCFIPISDICCIEIGNNSSLQCNFWSSNLNSADWSGDDFSGLGARFPDEHLTAGMKFSLQDMMLWITSTYITTRNSDEGRNVYRTKLGVLYIHGQKDSDNDIVREYKFEQELEKYFTLDSVLFHYLFTEYHCMVDNRAKNTFITYEWDKASKKFLWNYYKDYDNDTADGNDNSGGLEYTYGMSDLSYDSGGVYVFNSAQNTLWWNLREFFYKELSDYYNNNLQGEGKCFDSKRLLKKFNDYQLKRSEAAYIEDLWSKYLMPFYCQGNSMYLPKALGTKSAQRQLFETYQQLYMDSKYCGYTTKENIIQFRVGEASVGSDLAKSGEITLTPYSTQYITVQYDSTQIKALAFENEAVLIRPSGATDFKDTNVNIFNADNIIEINESANLYIGGATLNLKDASNIQKLKLGKHESQNSYINNRSFSLTSLLNNRKLQYLDLDGFSNLNILTLDFSLLNQLEEIYLNNTNLLSLIMKNKNEYKQNIFICQIPKTLERLKLKNVNIKYLYVDNMLITNITDLYFALPQASISIVNSIINNSEIKEG